MTTTRSEAVCRRNDTISPRLYRNTVSKGASGRKRQRRSRRTDEHFQDHVLQNCGRQKIPCDGQLWYRGYRVEDLIGSLGETELGYEKIAYLLLMGQMPDSAAAEEFRRLLGNLPTSPGTSS